MSPRAESPRTALVTGANRGIGFEICRQLARQGFRVLMTARDARRGQHAAKRLRKDGLGVHFHQLDVTDAESLRRAVAFGEGEFGGVDVLVNNAGVYPDEDVPGLSIDLDIVRRTMEVNAYGPLRLCQMMIPLMRGRRYGRIVNVSSGAGAFSEMTGGTLAYRVSKVSLNAITRILADEVRGTGILINAMCPGWVRTEMGGRNAPRSVEEGADTGVFLATLPASGPTGGFFRDRKPIPW
ncbi:MAG TPA: SDR family oxidoreductase [bacterium]|nr:SDR family oxidoreductase [bacterium]